MEQPIIDRAIKIDIIILFISSTSHSSNARKEALSGDKSSSFFLLAGRDAGGHGQPGYEDMAVPLESMRQKKMDK
jgi:hypothetical protein